MGRANNPAKGGQHPTPRRGSPRVPTYTGFESFRDSDTAPYYRSERRRLSSEETWTFINQRLHGLMRGVNDLARTGPVAITPDQLHRWHRYMFGEDFWSGGRVRRGDIEYLARIVEKGAVRERRQRGSAPDRIRGDLEAACRAFQAHINSVLVGGGEVEMKAGALAATELYAGILRIHPYEDGNGRAAFVALQAALRSQGMYAVSFDDITRHDEALGPALRSDIDPNPGPFAELVIERINAAALEVDRSMLGS
jgi:fido (protein-threonine AMPylation protein)